MKPITPHVTIKRGNGKIVIHSGYTIFHTQFPDSKRISCAIPAYDIYYSVDSTEMVIEKGRKIVKMYIDHFMSHSKSKLKDFVIQIHKLGFKAPNDAFTLKSIIEGKDTNTKFNSIKNLDESMSEQDNVVVDEMELSF